ncbi:MAG: microcin ABC transporter ATP-binding protein, partial [Gammaproteobacteria bacterium]
AGALACSPRLVIADEPTTALDVTTQLQILRLLKSLATEFDVSMLFVTHDLRVAAQICDLVAVMKEGRIVETGPAARVFTDPRAAYTRELVQSIPGRAWSGRASPSLSIDEVTQ